MHVHQQSRPGALPFAIVFAGALIAASSTAHALTLEASGSSDSSGAGAATAVVSNLEKVSTTPGLPYSPSAAGGGVGFGGTATSSPIFGAASITHANTYTAVAEPGDGPGEQLCLGFTYTASRTATITSGVVSIGQALGGVAGYSVDYTTQPVQIGLASPLQIRVQRASGPLDVLLNIAPIVEVNTASPADWTLNHGGAFAVRAGDVIELDMRLAVVGRGEVGGSANSFLSHRLEFQRRACPAAVPALSPSMSALLAAVMLVVALVTMVSRRRARR